MRKKLFLVVAVSIALIVFGFILHQNEQPKEPQILNEFAMDTFFRATLPGNVSAEEKANLVDELHRLDALLDRFDPLSDISRISLGAPNAVEINPVTWQITKDALDLAAKTGGKFDPTIGPLVDLWGLTTHQGMLEQTTSNSLPWEPPSQENIDKILPLVDYSLVELWENPYRIKLPKPGMVLDLGGIAKGYVLDRMVQLLKQRNHSFALIDFGGDVMAYGQHPEGRPWKLGIRHPRKPEDMIAVLQVSNRAVVTSGDYQRYRIFNDQRFSHLVDPDIGRPVQELTSVTIVAPTGIVADALSTAIFIMGKEKGQAMIESWPGVDAVIVDAAMEVWYSKGLEGSISFPAPIL
ncbi:MAG: FAD:protein FMN transferase [Syntrophomonadaceae bacterium]|nr:FAD:protein FMN transferase [Syntrophomonadaceae bacterium]